MRRMNDISGRRGSSRWLLLYVAYAVVLALLWLEGRAILPPEDHTLALLAIVFGFVGLAWTFTTHEGPQ